MYIGKLSKEILFRGGEKCPDTGKTTKQEKNL